MKKNFTIEEVWDGLLEYDFFTEAELQLITSINGYNLETLNDAIYARLGYHDFNQLDEVYNMED